MFTRTEVIIEARSWLNTKFRFQGRIKKNKHNLGGVDCLGLILCICSDLGYRYKNKTLIHYDMIYSKTPDYNILKEQFSKFFIIKDITELDVGDIILQQVSKYQNHLMFYAGKSVIHSSATAHKVVEHRIDNINNCIIYSMFK